MDIAATCYAYSTRYFVKMEFKLVPLVISKTSLKFADTNMAHPILSLGLSPKTIYNVGFSNIKSVKLKLLVGQ